MKYLIPMLILLLILALPVSAMEITAPPVPKSGLEVMPEKTDSFSDALIELLQNTILRIHPDITAALKVSVSVISVMMIVTILRTFSGNLKKTALLTGTVALTALLLQNSEVMIHLASDTISQLSEYGKLLFPVMTAGMAAQGGVTASAALYTGTVAFDLILSSIISNVLVPVVYLYLAFSVANCAVGEDLIKQMRDFVKTAVSWCLKTLITIFTTYMSITGVVSGTTDAAALKATKVTISSMVPVVGGILSDASEAVLVSAGVMKSAAGIYGIIAILAVFLEPFLKIGVQYLILKVTAALCSVFGAKEMTGLIEDFGTAMGLLLAMTGSVCLLLLISMICFMRGIG